MSVKQFLVHPLHNDPGAEWRAGGESLVNFIADS